MADAMKLVPEEPTEAMIEAMTDALENDCGVELAYIAALAVSPPAREEAPAEGAGEVDDAVTEIAVSTIRWAMGRGDDLKDYKEPLEHVLDAALRNRTSEPEAGAVAWLHTLHLELDQAFSRLTENPQHPFGKPGEDYSEEYRVSTTPLFTHPAPATADKLRVAVEALEPFARAAGKLDGLWAEDDWRWNESVRSNVTVRDIRRAALALAALNEGGE